MTENSESGIRKILRGNRLYWLIAVFALPIPAILAYNIFPIGCRCLYGSATADVFTWGIYILWARLFAGLVLGENRKKILIYLAMPFVVGLVISIIGPVIWEYLKG